MQAQPATILCFRSLLEPIWADSFTGSWVHPIEVIQTGIINQLFESVDGACKEQQDSASVLDVSPTATSR